MPKNKQVKRWLDLGLIFLSLPFWLPFIILLAILIKLDSAGPVFYTQKRIGYAGKEMKMWKFRSMTSEAAEELGNLLNQDLPAKMEWEQNFKLKKDPRVTRFGDILRRTSLDELPQLWNILRGEMSIIGPRPIVQDEIPLYGNEFEIYKQVLPGLTGLWQISGRNDLSYQERVNLDVYYVQNWSVWLDIRILIHTIPTVLEGKGAY
jgi:Undecaprenyl-phosphate galactose phosphotransferase WbaP